MYGMGGKLSPMIAPNNIFEKETLSFIRNYGPIPFLSRKLHNTSDHSASGLGAQINNITNKILFSYHLEINYFIETWLNRILSVQFATKSWYHRQGIVHPLF